MPTSIMWCFIRDKILSRRSPQSIETLFPDSTRMFSREFIEDIDLLPVGFAYPGHGKREGGSTGKLFQV